MNINCFFYNTLLIGTIFLFSCGNKQSGKQPSTGQPEQEQKTAESPAARPTKIKEEAVTYTADTTTLNGFIVYDDSKRDKRPIVLVVHEWWGLNNYTRMRARQLAKLGYIAMAVDMYGHGKTAANPKEAEQLAMPFYKDPQLTKTRLEAALAKVKTYVQADAHNTAAIGYCYGGFVVLNAAKLGANLKGVVSFHGGLGGVPPGKDLLKAAILICHGASDRFVPEEEIWTFRKQMSAIDAPYTFKVYPHATHAFTNPSATELGKKFDLPIAYNAQADSASWSDMQVFLSNIFTHRK